MLYLKYLIMSGAFLTLSSACSSNNDKKTEAENQPLTDKIWYANPVIDSDNPDPSVMKAEDGYFYLYATGGNIWIHRSKDLVHWDFVSGAFEDDKKPDWEEVTGIWAPDINYINGKYVMYYSMSSWGGGETCGIGVAVSDTPQGPFTDKGKLFRSNEIGVHNSIDPFYIEDEGKKYIFWGSWYGIWGVELSDDGLSLKGGIQHAKESKKMIAAASQNTNSYEGSYILKRGDYYYLFCSTGTCCEGVNSTYKTVVGRSTELFGEYVNKNGEKMLDNKHTVLIDRNEAFLGTGHNSEIVQDAKGRDWILYHAYRTADPDKGRVVLLDRVYWDEQSWPYLLGNGPVVKAEAPAF